MLKVYEIKTNKEVIVYGVESDKNGNTKFLIRDENEWKWVLAKYYSDKKKECEHNWIHVGTIKDDENCSCDFEEYECSKCGSYKYV